MNSPTSPGDSAYRRSELAAIAGIGALALSVRVLVGPHLRDDAYITLRYADHLANGGGFTFNLGERVLGTTTPLFTVLLTLFNKLGVPLTTAAVTGGVIADVLVVLLLWQTGRAVVGRSVGLLAALVYALLTPTVSYAVSGMETPLYLALILGAFELARRRHDAWCAVACGLLVLLRPDGLLVPATFAGFSLWHAARPAVRPRSVGTAVRRVWSMIQKEWLPILLFVCVVTPWLLVAWRYFGSPLSHSIVAKWSLPVSSFASLMYFGRYFLDLGDRWFLPLTALAALGLARVLRRRPALRPLPVWAVAYALAFFASNKFIYPLWPFEWYFLPLLLPYSIAVAAGIVALGDWLSSRLPLPRPERASAGIGLAAIFLIASTAHLVQTHELLDRVVAGRELLYAQLASRLASYGVTRDVVATPEIGAFGYSYPGPLLDLDGLISPSTVGKSRSESIVEKTPPWIVSYDTLIPSELQTSPWFEQHYRPVVSLVNWESRRLILFRWYPSPGSSFGRGPTLDGRYELVDRQLRWDATPLGQFLRVELTWRAHDTPTSRATFSLQLIGNGGALLAQQDNEPQEGTRPTTTWHQNELIVDRYDLRVSDPKTGDPAWLVALSYPTGEPSNTLIWRAPGGFTIGPRLAVPLPAPESPRPDTVPLQSCNASFGDRLRLNGFAVETEPHRLALHLRWEAAQTLDSDLTTFVHVLDGAGNVIAQADGPPLEGKAPTSTWLPGDRVNDERVISSETVGSADRIVIGWYLPSTGARLARSDGPGDSVTLRFRGNPACA